MRMIIRSVWGVGLLVLTSSLMYSCSKYWPGDKDAFSLDMDFSENEYKPILGRNTYYVNNFNADQSTLPLNFRIVSIRTFDGEDAPELKKLFPIMTWRSPYTGEERSLAEINEKRDTIMRPLWEIGERSGTFTMWNVASSEFVRTEPDSCYLFDVEVSNSGGRRYFRNLKLKPQLEQPYASSTILSGVVGDSTRQIIFPNVWFNRTGNGNSITFKFLDPKLNPIKLSKFNSMTQQDWADLVHGFDMQFASDSSSVTYDVAYPIPLVANQQTKYNDFSGAHSSFRYNRIAYGGYRVESNITLTYNIFQQGDWEVVVYFPLEAPLFDND